jgi:chemotaxis response regulator CheB
MPIKVLVADDTDIIRSAIMRVLSEDAAIEQVGEAVSFAEALELVASLRPDALILDLHMPDEDKCPPDVFRSQVSKHQVCVIGVSVWNDAKAKALSEAFGAKVFLDKTNLYTTLIPAIKEHCLKSKATTA